MTIRLYPSTPLRVDAGPTGTVYYNAGPATVYYATTEAVNATTHDGLIAVNSNVQLDDVQFIMVASEGATVSTTPIAPTPPVPPSVVDGDLQVTGTLTVAGLPLTPTTSPLLGPFAQPLSPVTDANDGAGRAQGAMVAEWPLSEAAGPIAADTHVPQQPRRTIYGPTTTLVAGTSKYNAFPALVKRPVSHGNDYVMMWMEGTTGYTFDGEIWVIKCPAASDPFVAANWSAPVKLFSHASQQWSPFLATVLANGDVLMSISVAVQTPAKDVIYVSRLPAGLDPTVPANWDTPVLIGTDGTPQYTVGSNCVELANGDVVMSAWAGNSPMEAWVWRLTFNGSGAVTGATKISTLTPPTALSFNEPTLVLLPSGRLLMLIRVYYTSGLTSVGIWGCYSNDNGVTWTTPRRMFQGIALPSVIAAPDGDVVAITRWPVPATANQATGPGVYYTSGDEGATWQGPFALNTNVVRGSFQGMMYGQLCNIAAAGTDGNLAIAVAEDDGAYANNRADILLYRLTIPGTTRGRNPGQYRGTITYNQAGPTAAQPAISLDGTSAFVMFPKAWSGELEARSFRIGGWINWGGAAGRIAYQSTSGLTRLDFQIAADGSLSLDVGNIGPSSAAGAVTSSAWHHVEAVWDADLMRAMILVDRKVVGSRTTTDVGAITNTYGDPLTLGAKWNGNVGTAPSNFLGGLLADWTYESEGVTQAPAALRLGAVVVHTGSGAPATTLIGAKKGDLYFRTDTPTTADQRVYINTADGAGNWTGIL